MLEPVELSSYYPSKDGVYHALSTFPQDEGL